jgi:hypothetical protein
MVQKYSQYQSGFKPFAHEIQTFTPWIVPLVRSLTLSSGHPLLSVLHVSTQSEPSFDWCDEL